MARPILYPSLSVAVGLALGIPALAQTQLPANALSTSPAATTSSPAPHRSSSVTFQDGQLTVNATNASLNSILHEIARSTGMKLTGSVPEDRVFGTYGPADPQLVMSTLLDGTGTNILIVSNTADQPLELHLSPRVAAPTPPNPNAAAQQGEADPPNPLPEPESQSDSNDGQNAPGHGPRRFGKPEAPDPAAATAPSETDQPIVFPAISPTSTPATGTTTPVDPQDDTDTSTEGVKTPQQIFEQLQHLQQTNTGSGNSTNPASNTTNSNSQQNSDQSQQ